MSKLTDLTVRRRRRANPSYAKSTDVKGGNTKEATVYGLAPYTAYTLAIKAFNIGGEGPSSDEVTFDTIEDGMLIKIFSEYVTWHFAAENIHTSPTEGIFVQDPPKHLEIPITVSLIHIFN